MDSAKGWFQKRQMRGGSRYKGGSGGDEGSSVSADEQPHVETDEEAVSNTTKQKVAAAKQYIENHYKEQMKILQERKERYIYISLFFFSTKMLRDLFTSFGIVHIKQAKHARAEAGRC